MDQYVQVPLRCPHCRKTLIDCFLVNNYGYLVCSRCAIQYLEADCLNYDIVKAKLLRSPQAYRLNTNTLAQHIRTSPPNSIRNLLRSQAILEFYRSNQDFEVIKKPANEGLDQSEQPQPEKHNSDHTPEWITRQNIQRTIEAVSQMIPPEVHLHYQVGKHVLKEKYQEMKEKGLQLAQQCSNKWDRVRDRLRSAQQEIPSDLGEAKEMATEALQSLKRKWRSIFN